MNPWWLRPPADEETDGGEESEKSAAVVPQEPKLEKATRKSDSGTRRDGRGKGSAARHRPAGGKSRRPKSTPQTSRAGVERQIALFCDLESLALGLREANIRRFDPKPILDHLRGGGRIAVKKAYADWNRYGDFKRRFHDAGMELIDIPGKPHLGKNSADVKLAVDAMELCYSRRHLDTFIIISGDGDFSPLAAKLKENDKRVIGVGIRRTASQKLIENCDEYLDYETLSGAAESLPEIGGVEERRAEVFALLVGVVRDLLRDSKGPLWGSMVKQTMKRQQPLFEEGQYGYSSFSELLEDAERHRIIVLERDDRSGSYVIAGCEHQGP